MPSNPVFLPIFLRQKFLTKACGALRTGIILNGTVLYSYLTVNSPFDHAMLSTVMGSTKFSGEFFSLKGSFDLLGKKQDRGRSTKVERPIEPGLSCFIFHGLLFLYCCFSRWGWGRDFLPEIQVCQNPTKGHRTGKGSNNT
ncbi:unnamed protein product, partial [Tuber aestivum]